MEPQRGEISQDLAGFVTTSGPSQELRHANLRVAGVPSHVEFSDELIGGQMKRVRTEYYETAMWVPLLEKAMRGRRCRHRSGARGRPRPGRTPRRPQALGATLSSTA